MNAARMQSQTGGAPSPSVVRTNTVAGIEAIFDPRVNLVVWERDDAGQPQLDDSWPDLTGRRIRTIERPPYDADTVADLLGLAHAPRLADDIAGLCELFATITGATTLGLRVDITDRATCPRFHGDRVALRLMTTYRGPATEWLEGGVVQRARAGDVLLAKGEIWPGLECGPCLHRSPEPSPGRPRVLLTVDAL